MGMFHSYINTVVVSGQDEGTDKRNKGNAWRAALLKNTHFQNMLRDLEEKKRSGLPLHPKMEKLKTLLINHFVQNATGDDDGGHPEGNDSRVMVFASYRECVEDIVEYLNLESPLIKAMRFIGQGSDKKVNKGFDQKEQSEVCRMCAC